MIHKLFALEQYERTAGAEQPVPAFGTAGCRLIAAVRLPSDEVVLALVEGADAATVAEAAEAAAWRVDRMTPAQWIRPPGTSPADTSPAGTGSAGTSPADSGSADTENREEGPTCDG